MKQPKKEAAPAPEILSDKQLVDYLARRSYVEATDKGYEDPKRFEFHGGQTFRLALSRHILRHRRKTR